MHQTDSIDTTSGANGVAAFGARAAASAANE
jgi:hypothetical protein